MPPVKRNAPYRCGTLLFHIRKALPELVAGHERRPVLWIRGRDWALSLRFTVAATHGDLKLDLRIACTKSFPAKRYFYSFLLGIRPQNRPNTILESVPSITDWVVPLFINNCENLLRSWLTEMVHYDSHILIYPIYPYISLKPRLIYSMHGYDAKG